MQDATVAGAREGNAGMMPASEVFQMISYNPIFQTEDIEFKNPNHSEHCKCLAGVVVPKLHSHVLTPQNYCCQLSEVETEAGLTQISSP